VPWLLLTLGVAVAVALPVLAAGLRSESAVAAVVSTVDALRPADRTVLAAIEQAGLPLDESLVVPGDYTQAGGRRGMAALLELPRRPTAEEREQE